MKETFYVKGKPLTAKIHKEGKNYVSICEEIGTAEWGNSKEEALKNLQECTEAHLYAFPIDWLKAEIKVKHAKTIANFSPRVN